jgi:hypothetical protein
VAIALYIGFWKGCGKVQLGTSISDTKEAYAFWAKIGLSAPKDLKKAVADLQVGKDGIQVDAKPPEGGKQKKKYSL